MWVNVGMARSEEGLKKAVREFAELRERFWKEVKVPGSAETLNQSLEVAGRVADFLEFAEIMAYVVCRADGRLQARPSRA